MGSPQSPEKVVRADGGEQGLSPVSRHVVDHGSSRVEMGVRLRGQIEYDFSNRLRPFALNEILCRRAVFDENVQRQQDASFLRVKGHGSDGGDDPLRLAQVAGGVVDAHVANADSFEEEVVHRRDRRFGVVFEGFERRKRFFRQIVLSRIDDPQQPGFRQVVFDDGLMQLGDDGIPAANGLRRVEHGAHRIAPKLHSHLADHSILDAVTDLGDFDVEGSDGDGASPRLLGKQQSTEKVFELVLANFLETEIQISITLVQQIRRSSVLSDELLFFGPRLDASLFLLMDLARVYFSGRIDNCCISVRTDVRLMRDVVRRLRINLPLSQMRRSQSVGIGE